MHYFFFNQNSRYFSSLQKHMLWVLIRSASVRCFWWVPTTYFFVKKLSGAMNTGTSWLIIILVLKFTFLDWFFLDKILKIAMSGWVLYFLCPATKKVVGYYVIPSEILSVRPSAPPPFFCLQLLLQFWANPFQTLQALLGWSEDMHNVFSECWNYFLSHFCIFNLDFFRALILQKCIGSMYLLPATPPTVLGQSFSNFTGTLRMVWRYAYCFFRILKLFFITFFAFLT